MALGPLTTRQASPAAAPVAADDGRLLRRTIGGDEAAVRRLVERHLPRVVAVARRMLGDASEADDVAQETFLALVERAVVPDPAGPWLFRVVRNRAVSAARSESRPSACRA